MPTLGSRICRSHVGNLAAFDILQFEMKKIWLRLQVSTTFSYREESYFSGNKVIIGDQIVCWRLGRSVKEPELCMGTLSLQKFLESWEDRSS